MQAEKAENMYKLCEEFGWIPVSMKNDWTTIYGDSVTKKVGVDEALAPSAWKWGQTTLQISNKKSFKL